MTTGRLLIVDDEEGMLHAAQRVLKRYELRAAASPREALAATANFRPDLAILDVRMPEMDGFALAEALRERFPGMEVIFMTGSHTEPDANLIRAMRSQAFYFIQKPFDRQVLLTLVERCLELRTYRETARAHTARLEHELADARAFQTAMLQPHRTTLAGIPIEACCRPSQELGGDLYDYAVTCDGDPAFIVADVSGHGAAAALLTAVVMSAFRADASYEPLGVVRRLAGAIRLFGECRFVTCLCGRIDLKRGVLDYVNAGHPAGALLHHGHVAELTAEGPMVMSAFADDSWALATAPWRPGSRLAVCTDGLMDAMNVAMGRTGAVLAEALTGTDTSAGVVESLLARTREALGGRPAPDDITVLAAG